VKKKSNSVITVVSGLPRSGTSMMMKMLEAGNMLLLTDRVRIADADNPKGYYEYEKVKEMENDNSWMDKARGKTVKIVSPILYHLNLGEDYTYKIIFMLRDLDETLASQKKMADRLGQNDDIIKDNILKEKYSLHLEEIYEWLQQQKNIYVLYVNYTDVLENPLATAEGISEFLDQDTYVEEMAAVVDKSLYRQRLDTIDSCDLDTSLCTEEDNDAIIERLKQLNYM
jgi:hypothetical protein